jgi:hypothetical protein
MRCEIVGADGMRIAKVVGDTVIHQNNYARAKYQIKRAVGV